MYIQSSHAYIKSYVLFKSPWGLSLFNRYACTLKVHMHVYGVISDGEVLWYQYIYYDTFPKRQQVTVHVVCIMKCLIGACLQFPQIYWELMTSQLS